MLIRKKWFLPALMGLFILVAAGTAFVLSRPQGDQLYQSVRMEALSAQERGVEPDSAFSVSLNWRVSEAQLREMLTVQPGQVAYTLEGGGKHWTLTPNSPLDTNQIYTFQVQNPQTGQVVQSFAFQTVSDLLVSRAYPWDGRSSVPVETGIEITFNAEGVDLEGFLEIKPETAGSFQQNGNTVIFQPAQPLDGNSIYRVTVKAGASAADGRTLQEDYTFSFETDRGDGKSDYERLRLSGDFAETFLPGDSMVVSMVSGVEIGEEEFTTTIYRYPSIDGYMETLRAYDAFYNERYGRKTDYIAPTDGLEQVAQLEGPLVRQEPYGELYALLPNDLAEGWYLVTVAGPDAEGEEQFVQKLMQVQNLSVYSQSQNGETLLWLNNPASGQPMGNVPLVLEDVEPLEGEERPVVREAVTRQDGVAQVPTGQSEAAYLSVTEDGEVIYFSRLPLSQEQEPSLSQLFASGLYTDRELYQPQDTIQFWGVLSPRRGAQLPSVAYVELAEASQYSPVERVQVAVNADGTFTGSIPVNSLKSSGYSLMVTDGKEGVYCEKYLSIQPYEKPAYLIQVTTDKEWYTVTEPVTFQISASYYDGTPAAGVELWFSGNFGQETAITLDEQGKATHTARLSSSAWQNEDGSPVSWEPQWFSYTVYNRGEESGYIGTYGQVRMLPSLVAVQLESEDPSQVTIRTAQLDTAKLDDPVAQPRIWGSSYEQLAGAPVDLPVTVVVHRDTYVKVPDGSYYDYVNRETVTRYRTELETRVVATHQAQTVGGVAQLTDLPYSENTEEEVYWFEVRVDGGVAGQVQESFRYISPYRGRFGQPGYTFFPEEFDGLAAPGDSLELGLYRDGIKVSNTGRVFYTVLQDKVLDSGTYHTASQSLEVTEEWTPNVILAGAYFDGRHIYPIEEQIVSRDTTEKQLQIAVTPDREQVRPGETVTLNLKVTDWQGNPVQASTCVGVVDESLFALMDQQVALLEQLYGNVYYSYVSQNVSYKSYALMEESAADAEKANPNTAGGSASYQTQMRQEFLDTALFFPVTTAADGTAQIALQLPDNVTGWRVTAVAVTPDLKAGDTTDQVIATLPFYLRPLYTTSYLEKDDVTAAVSTAGTALSGEETIEYRVRLLDEEGQELQILESTGLPGVRIAFNFGKLQEGNYQLEFIGNHEEYTDGIQVPFVVLKQAATVDRIKQMTIEELSSLKPVEYPVDLVFYDNRMAPYVQGILTLSGRTGERTERLAANWMAQLLYQQLLPEEDRSQIVQDARLEEIQDIYGDGGVRALPSGGSEPEVTAKLLVTCPQLLNTAAAEEYLETVLQDPAATQNDRVMAYLGLSSLKKPLMLEISRMLEEPGLTDSQRLYLGAALAQLGDFTNAHRVYDELEVQKESDLLYLLGDGTQKSRMETTAAALMLTSLISDPDADGLMAYLCIPENSRTMNTQIVCDLEMLCYLNQFTPPMDGDVATFRYQLDGETQEVTLSTPAWKAVQMGKAQLQAANFEQVSGEVAVAVRYRDYAPQPTENSDRVIVTKQYIPLDGQTLETAGRVRVDVTLEFAEDAPEGCYTITDYIPSGMRWLNSIASQYWNSTGSHLTLNQDGQTVRGWFYRVLPEEENDSEPLQEKVLVSEPVEMPVEEPIADSPEENQPVVFTYYLTAVLPGEYAIEPVTVTFDSLGESAVGNSSESYIVIESRDR